MYIAPNTTIRFMSNIPLDSSYRNTIFFMGVSEQTSWFNSRTLVYSGSNTYQRVSSNKLRVAGDISLLMSCNYMSLNNGLIDTRIFYCFITNVEYVNNETVEITYELDVMQSLLFRTTVLSAFVEREHTQNDSIGNNLQEEGLDLGEYTSRGNLFPDVLNSTSIVLATVSVKDTVSSGGWYGGIYSGANYSSYSNDTGGSGALSDRIDHIVADGKESSIVSIFIMPTAFVTAAGSSSNRHTYTAPNNFSDIDGYVPKNNKLFTFPYNFLRVTNLQGGIGDFPYEFFAGNVCSFDLDGDMTCSPSVILTPKNYKGAARYYNEKMTLSGYPQCTYAVDTFKTWVAQNSLAMAVGAIGTVVGGATGNIPVMGAGAATLVGLAHEGYKKSISPIEAKGSGGAGAMIVSGMQNFCFTPITIRAEQARVLDEFFEMYGYATNRVKIPNRSSRPCWNYVKTKNCFVTGREPARYIKKIEEIYNNGITFWKPSAVIGDYSQNNHN